MKQLFESWKKYVISESSLSRVLQHIENHDCATITAFRSNPDDLSRCVLPEKEEVEEAKKDILSKNKLRNRDLKASLLDKGYGVTNVVGSYVENFMEENSIEVKEDSLFVVNLKDSPDFFSTIEKLGKIFCQDSVLIIPKGGQGAYLLGTNKSEFPGLGNKEIVGDFVGGKEKEFMTRVRDRPFAFTSLKEYKLETFQDHSKNARWAIRSISEKVLK